ncbi:MAG: hypothetical protein QF541_11880 [Lentisphaeria bacterium]|jgi:hypothetical protein|nr:hypothetical protein [Lentisphaeria bacterium]
MRDLTRDPSMMYVQEEVQTFLDNLMIHHHGWVSRRWHNPVRDPDGPVICKDRPWEHLTYFSLGNSSILRDPEDGLFKCWYEDLVLDRDRMMESVVPHGSRQLYAESEDGIEWRKPELDIVEEQGHKTNIVIGNGAAGCRDSHSMSVVIDPYPPSADQRFRALFTHRPEGDIKHSKRLICAHSADGIHWQRYEQPPRFGRSGPRLDDVSILFYDPDAREFVQNTRHFLKGPGCAGNPDGGIHHFASYGRRRVWQTRSHDFLHWSEPVLIAAVDEEDGLDDEYYGMAQYRCGTIHLATVGVFRNVENEREVQLLMSRDGLRWQTTARRQPFLAPRGPGHYDAHQTALSSPPIAVGDELWFYNGGSSCHHDWWMWGKRDGIDHPEVHDPSLAEFSLGIARLRQDGYASLYANPYTEGFIITQSMMSEGVTLIINARCAANGHVKVQVQDEFNKPIEPCTKENADPFTGDSTAHTVSWNGDPTIPDRKWRRLVFFLKDAEIFSFRFAGHDGRRTVDEAIETATIT